MNYRKIYFDLIAKAKSETKTRRKSLGYFEGHHILPKSLGGTDKPENLVNLTAREHFIAHALLIRFLKGDALNKMKWAFHQICTWSPNAKTHGDTYINSRIYEKFKSDFQKGENNSQYGTKWWYNQFTGEIIKSEQRPSEEYINGRKDRSICKAYHRRQIRLDRVRSNSKITKSELNDRVNRILNSNVDLTKFGWVNKVSKVTNLTRREINYTVNNSSELKKLVYYRSPLSQFESG
jgi:hypothetical protein